MPNSKSRSTIEQRSRLRTRKTTQHHNDLVVHIDALTTQSPSERCLFGKYRELEGRLKALEAAAQPGSQQRGVWSPTMRSPREIYLERECEWLRAELRRYTK